MRFAYKLFMHAGHLLVVPAGAGITANDMILAVNLSMRVLWITIRDHSPSLHRMLLPDHLSYFCVIGAFLWPFVD